MVLLALGILAVSVLFLAYKYISKRANVQAQHEEQRKVTENGTGDDEKEKVYPAFKLYFSGAVETENDTDSHKPVDMKNPFEDEKSSVKSTNDMLPPSLVPTTNRQYASSAVLMPPPSRSVPKPTTTQALPTPSTPTNLRTQPSTASTLRAPPGRPPTTSTLLTPSTSILAPSSRSSKKVLLEPGHSPLDWAHLTANPPSSTFLRGADVPPNLIRVPPSLLKYHNGRKDKETGKIKDAWGLWQGKVYNMTPYMKFHPGGPDQLMRGAGNTKAEQLFKETHSWVSWENMMGECLVGILISENEAHQANAMEEMD